MIDSDEIKNRFREVVVEVDARGRAITVGRLKLSQQSRANEWTDNDLNRVIFLVVASVRAIDDMHLAFPKNRAEIESRLDVLDDEGFEAAGKAWRKLYGVADVAPAEGEDVERAA